MDCLGNDLTLRYLARELDDAVQQRIDEHLDSCAACRRLLAALAQTSLLAASGEAPPLAAWTSDYLPAGVRIGRYIVRGRLGSGAMGVVYRAEDPQLRRDVAIKQIRAGLANDTLHQERLIREAQSLARLSHPNVVPIYDVGVHAGHVFLAMEVVDAVTLRRWLERPRDRDAILSTLQQAGQGLAAAHRAGLVHRDLKPENILVGRDGRTLVTDFGLVALSGAMDVSTETAPSALEATDVPPSATGSLIGTPAYMAPEQLIGGTVEPASDQFAFAVTTFEALLGRRPFGGNTPGTIHRAIVAREIDPAVRRLPHHLRRTLRRALNPQPTKRFPSMEDLLQALQGSGRRRAVLLGVGATAVVASAMLAGLRPTQEGRLAPLPDPAATAPDTGRDDAEALLAEGRALTQRGEFKAAAHQLEAAHEAASAGAMWATAADAATALVQVHGTDREDYDAGEAWHRHATSALSRLGPDAEREVGLAHAVAKLDTARARYAEARAGFERVVTRYLELAGEDDVRVAQARSNLGSVLAHLDELDAAVAMHRRALASPTVAAQPAVRAQMLVALSNALSARGDKAQARASVESALALLDEDDPLLGRTANNLAVLLISQGELPAAEQALEQAEVALTRSFGPEHPNLANVILSRGNVAAMRSQPDDARTLFERALGIRERALGLTHHSLLPMLQNLANLARQQGDHASARRHLTRALAITQAVRGSAPAEVAAIQEDLANMLAGQGEFDEAVALLDQAYATREASVGADHPSLCRIWLARGKIEIDRGSYKDGERALARALQLAPTGGYRAAVLLARAESKRRRGARRAALKDAREARELVRADPRYVGVRASVDSWFESLRPRRAL